MISEERAFLHDLNNKLAIIDGRLAILIRKIEKPEGLPAEKIVERAKAIKATIAEIAQLTTDRRATIIEMEDAS